MSKKLFKRLLITTSLLSPIAVITPIVLTTYGLSETQKELNNEVVKVNPDFFDKDKEEDNDQDQPAESESSEVDFIDLSKYDKKDNDYVFKGKLSPLNKNLKDVKIAKEWLIAKSSELTEEGGNEEDKDPPASESNLLNFEDSVLVELIDIANNKLINEKATQIKNDDEQLDEEKTLFKKDINSHGVDAQNTIATVTISAKNDAPTDDTEDGNPDAGEDGKCEENGGKVGLFLTHDAATDSDDNKPVGSIKIEFKLKEGFSWKTTSELKDKEEKTQPKVILEFDVDSSSNILNPVDEFLKPSVYPSSKTGQSKEYLLVGTEFSQENETWQKLARELATLSTTSEEVGKDQYDVDTAKTLNDKRVNVLTSAFKDIKFDQEEEASDTETQDQVDNNSSSKEADKVDSKAKESIKDLLKDVNLMNLVYSSTKASSASVEYGSVIYSGFLNLDYLFEVADVSLKVTSKKTEKNSTYATAASYKIDSYSYDLEIIFTLKTSNSKTDENKWIGLKESAPIRILFSNIYDTKTSVGLDEIIEKDSAYGSSVSTSFDFNVDFEDSEDILKDATDETTALQKIYEKLTPDKFMYDNPSQTGITPPTLDGSNHDANLDDKKYAADKLVKFLMEKMGDQDFTFSSSLFTDDQDQDKETPIKNAFITDWFFTDRFSTKITVNKSDLSSTDKDYKDPSPSSPKKKFTFTLEFAPKEGFEWALKNTSNADKPIKLIFNISQKSDDTSSPDGTN